MDDGQCKLKMTSQDVSVDDNDQILSVDDLIVLFFRMLAEMIALQFHLPRNLIGMILLSSLLWYVVIKYPDLVFVLEFMERSSP